MSARHGTTAGYGADCREACCRKAWAASKRHRHREIAYGRWQPLFDAAPVAQRLRELLNTGASMVSIAEAAGIPRATLIKTMGPLGSRPATKRVRPHVAEAVLALTPEMFAPLSSGDPMDEALALIAPGADVEDAARRTGVLVVSVVASLRRAAQAAGPGSDADRLHRRIVAQRKAAGEAKATAASREAAATGRKYRRVAS